MGVSVSSKFIYGIKILDCDGGCFTNGFEKLSEISENRGIEDFELLEELFELNEFSQLDAEIAGDHDSFDYYLSSDCAGSFDAWEPIHLDTHLPMVGLQVEGKNQLEKFLKEYYTGEKAPGWYVATYRI